MNTNNNQGSFGYQQLQDENDIEINPLQQTQQANLEKSTVRLLIQQKHQQLQQLDQKKVLKYLKIVLAAFILFGIFYLISLIIYSILNMIDTYIIIALILTAWYFILASVASLGFFIGQFWFVRREILNGINNMPLFDFPSNFQDLKNFIEYIQKPNMDKKILYEEWQKASGTIQLGKYLQKLEENPVKNLTNNQKIIKDDLFTITEKLKEVKCQDKQGKCHFTSLYDLLSNDQQFRELASITNSSNFVRFEQDQEYIKSEVLQRIQNTLETLLYFNKINQDKRDEYLYEYDPIVSFPLYQEYMKQFLNAESFYIEGNDKKKLDCFFVPTPKIEKKTAVLKMIKGDEPPIMIMLNKNSCYFEQEAFASVVKFYLNLGINVVSMNYRGYGESKGYPWITDIEQDGENLVKFVRDKYKPKKLGIHGWSMGGMFATYLANKCSLDFLFADRTFSRPCEAARYLIENRPVIQKNFPYLGKFCNILLKNLPYQNWGRKSGKNFAEFSGAKLLAYDPNDEIIPYLASLKNSVTCELFDYKFSPQLYSGIQSVLGYNQKYKRLEAIEISKQETKDVYHDMILMKEIVTLQSKGIGNGIGDELKRIFQVLKYDQFSFFDVLNQKENLMHETFQQFLINIVVYETILSPNSMVDKLNYFEQELKSLSENLNNFEGETGIKNKIKVCIPRMLALFLKIKNTCAFKKATNDGNLDLSKQKIQIMSVNVGHNDYMLDTDFQQIELYLRQIEFIHH